MSLYKPITIILLTFQFTLCNSIKFFRYLVIWFVSFLIMLEICKVVSDRDCKPDHNIVMRVSSIESLVYFHDIETKV